MIFTTAYSFNCHDVLAFLCQPPRDPDPSGPEGMISVAISSHYFFGEDQRTAQLDEIVRKFPTWAFPSSWVSTYDMYRYWELRTSEVDCRMGSKTAGERGFHGTVLKAGPAAFSLAHKHAQTLSHAPSRPAWETTPHCVSRPCSLMSCKTHQNMLEVSRAVRCTGHKPHAHSLVSGTKVFFFFTQSVVPLLYLLHLTPLLPTSFLFLPLSC